MSITAAATAISSNSGNPIIAHDSWWWILADMIWVVLMAVDIQQTQQQRSPSLTLTPNPNPTRSPIPKSNPSSNLNPNPSRSLIPKSNPSSDPNPNPSRSPIAKSNPSSDPNPNPIPNSNWALTLKVTKPNLDPKLNNKQLAWNEEAIKPMIVIINK